MKRLAIILILGVIINVVVIDRLHTLLNVRYDNNGGWPVKVERRHTEESRDAEADRLSVIVLSAGLAVADVAMIVWIYRSRTKPRPKVQL